MKIIEHTETKLSIQPELKKNRIFGILFAFFVFIFFTVVLPLRFPLSSTLSCDRINLSKIKCHLQEIFTVGFKAKRSLNNLLYATHKTIEPNLYYVRLELKQNNPLLNLIKIQNQTIGFPTNQGFIILSQKQEREIVKKINDFIDDSTAQTLTIEKHFEILPILVWLIIVAIAFFVSAAFLFWPFKTYIFDKKKQVFTIVKEVKIIGTKQIQYPFHEIKTIECIGGIQHPEYSSNRSYIVAVTIQTNNTSYYLGNAKNKITANQMIQLIEHFLQPQNQQTN